jgi:uncharacterized membrane protein HdeD (DUF308 family)
MKDATPPTPPEIAMEIKSGGGWMIGLGILTVIFGMIAITTPAITGLAVSLMVGIFLAAGGVMQIIHAFKIPSGGGRRIFLILAGLFAVGFGLFMTTQPVKSLLAMTLVLVAFFLVDGVCKIIDAFHLKPEKGWGWVLASGIITLVLAIMIWRRWPVSGAWAIGTLFGINILFSGWAMIFTGGALRSMASGGKDAS